MGRHPLEGTRDALRDFAEQAFPITEEEQGRFGVKVGQGIGSTTVFILARLLPGGQFLLPAAAASIGAGEAIQRAAEAGASDEQQARAGLLRIAPGLTDIRGIGNALIDAAPRWAQMRAQAASGEIPASLDITTALQEAVAVVRRARR